MYSGKKFIFDRMTIADISIFSQLHYLYTTVKYEVPAKYKNLNAFMENMRQTLKLKSLQSLMRNRYKIGEMNNRVVIPRLGRYRMPTRACLPALVGRVLKRFDLYCGKS